MSKKEKFFWWKIILTVLSFIFAVLAKSNIDWTDLSNNYFDFYLAKEILYDLCVGVFSAMILIWFIDEINERIQDTKNRNKEIEEIKRAHRLLHLYIERYKLFFYCVVTPIDKRNFNTIAFPLDFKFKDMKDLYKTTLLISEGAFDTSLESFVNAERTLREEIETIIKDIDFSYFPQIQECLLEFVEVSLKYNQQEAWLKAKTTTTGDKTLANMVEDILEHHADDWYSDIINGKNQYEHNIIHSYFTLHAMLCNEQKAISKYEQALLKL